jgi:hypothetical protein
MLARMWLAKFVQSAATSLLKKGFVICHHSENYLFGTATYVDYLTFSHLNPITNPTPLPNATLTIGATARKPNYWGSRVYPNYRGSRTQP